MTIKSCNNPCPAKVFIMETAEPGLPCLICHFLHERVHLSLWRCQCGGGRHCVLHHLGLHVQVLKLPLKPVHKVRNLWITEYNMAMFTAAGRDIEITAAEYSQAKKSMRKKPKVETPLKHSSCMYHIH